MRARSAKSSAASARLPLGPLREFASGVLRRLRSRAPYSLGEVRARLRQEPSPTDPRTEAVHATAAEIGTWMQLLPREAAREDQLGLAASRLPSVVFWYRRGVSPREIGRRLTPFGETCYGDRAVDAASALIAEVLNRRGRT